MNKYNCPNTCIDENTGKVRRRMPAANGLIPSHNGSLAFICRQPLDFTSTALPLQRKPESFEDETHSISSSHYTVHHWLIIYQHHTITLTPIPQTPTKTWTPCIVSLIWTPHPHPPFILMYQSELSIIIFHCYNTKKVLFSLSLAVQTCVLIKGAQKLFFFLVSVLSTEYTYRIDGINILNDCSVCGISSLPV